MDALRSEVSHELRSFFARQAMVQVLHRRCPCWPYLTALAKNSRLQELKLPCMAHVLLEPDAFLKELAEALQQLPQLKTLHLDLGWRSIYANGRTPKEL